MRIGQQELFLGMLGIVGSLLWAYPWLEAGRSQESASVVSTFIVTSSFDNGPGSLREAIFSAGRASRPARILIRAKQVDLTTPLPPLVGQYPVSLRSESNDSRATIDATQLPSGSVLDFRTAGTVEAVAIRGAPESAVHVSGDDPVVLRDVWISGSDVGVTAGQSYALEISNLRLSGNRIGVELLGAGSASIRNTSFSDQTEAGLWATGPADAAEGIPTIIVEESRFAGADYGLVFANVQVVLRNNLIAEFSDDGVLALGGVAEISSNRISSGTGAAIRSVGLARGNFLRNEISENVAIGILVQGSSGVRLAGNNIYRNGFGIVTIRNVDPSSIVVNDNLVVAQQVDGVVTVGDSPIVTGNTALRNTAAGIRLYHLVYPDRYLVSAPFLQGNILDGNGFDEPAIAEYHVEQ